MSGAQAGALRIDPEPTENEKRAAQWDVVAVEADGVIAQLARLDKAVRKAHGVTTDHLSAIDSLVRVAADVAESAEEEAESHRAQERKARREARRQALVPGLEMEG